MTLKYIDTSLIMALIETVFIYQPFILTLLWHLFLKIAKLQIEFLRNTQYDFFFLGDIKEFKHFSEAINSLHTT